MDQTPKKFGQSELQLIVLVVASVLLGLSALWGIYSGFGRGRALATYQNVATLNKALGYYNSDQGSYPSAVQLYQQRILIPTYLSDMPDEVNPSGACKGSKFVYTQGDPSSFALQFCLEQGINGISSGYHILTDKGFTQ